MSRRKKTQAYLEQAHLDFLNENAKACSSTKSKIDTFKYIKPVNVHQKQFVKSIKQNQLTIGSGCAGTGKTLLALFTAIQLINNPESPIEKVSYIRANVDNREEKEIGALPGDLLEKVRHLAYPILDNLELFMPSGTIEYLISNERIEILPLMMMRGRSFNNRIVIVDECQNIGPSSMKTIMTRICEDSKLVLIGDPDQCDIDPFKNGLKDLEWRLGRRLDMYEESGQNPEIDFDIIKFNKNDIIRSYVTKFAIDLYEL